MKKGDKVNWSWGQGKAEGTITEKFEKPVKKKIKGTEVKRKASKEEPAYLVEQDKGTKVVKSQSELKTGPKKGSKKSS